MLASGIEFKNALGNGGIGFINRNRVIQFVVDIAQGWTARIDALGCFFPHSFFHFLAQVLNVIAGDHQLNAMYQLSLRLRFLADNLAFFGEMDFYAQIFERDAIGKVAVQAVGLFDNHDPAFRMLLEELHHLAKLFAARGLGGFNVYKFAQDLDSIFERIFAEEL
ncbi:MAG TPA: hypothetical protein VFR24_05295 [Candidatus Angelobacter sp.]|nr:hypothetical protein [Candidatus Angelobacter sp.]